MGLNDPSRTFNADLIHTTRDVIDLAEAITHGALVRTESQRPTGGGGTGSETASTG